MARTICGFVYGPKETHDEVEKSIVNMILCIKGAKGIHSGILFPECEEYTFEYVLFGFPRGACLLEKHPSAHQLRLTLHFAGSAEVYEGEDSLAERILKYWEDNEVRIGRDR